MAKRQEHLYEVTVRPTKGQISPRTITVRGLSARVNQRGDLLIGDGTTANYEPNVNAAFSSGSWLSVNGQPISDEIITQ